MVWYLMLMLSSPLSLMFGLLFRGDRARLVLGGLTNDYCLLAA
jgi:hypothetical protein